MVGGKSESHCVGTEQLTSWVGGDLICQDLGVSPEWSDYRPQFKGPKVPPSELAILNPGPRSGPAGEG